MNTYSKDQKEDYLINVLLHGDKDNVYKIHKYLKDYKFESENKNAIFNFLIDFYEKNSKIPTVDYIKALMSSDTVEVGDMLYKLFNLISVVDICKDDVNFLDFSILDVLVQEELNKKLNEQIVDKIRSLDDLFKLDNFEQKLENYNNLIDSIVNDNSYKLTKVVRSMNLEDIRKEIADLEYLFYSFIIKNNINLLYGTQGVGKSWFAFSIAKTLVEGNDFFFDYFENPYAGTHQKVLWIDYEARGTQLKVRSRYINPEADSYFMRPRPEDLNNIRLSGKKQNSLDEEAFLNLEEYIIKEDPMLVVLDTFAAACPNNNINDPINKVVMDKLQQMADRIKKTIIVIMHEGKDESKGIIGCSGVNDSPPIRLKFTKYGDKDSTVRKIDCLKNTFGPEEIFYLKIEDNDLHWLDPSHIPACDDSDLVNKKIVKKDELINYLKDYFDNNQYLYKTQVIEYINTHFNEPWGSSWNATFKNVVKELKLTYIKDQDKYIKDNIIEVVEGTI